ncbi:MAG TPA: hypothetical protein ENH91_09925 [Leeuwenhoekiella sp.]|nr:hypothetical protein [Leeuwenhoekiella sp.]
MNHGYLSEYFVGIAAKRLSAVEADTNVSNQHEFNGSRELKRLLGTGSGQKKRIVTKFIWLGEVNEGISSEGFVTWYDARLDHPTRSEYRLYFSTNDVTSIAERGDMLFIGKRTDGTLIVIVTVQNSTIENQLLWLFGLPSQTGLNFEGQNFDNINDVEIDFIVRFIFDELGIDIEEPETDSLDDILIKFNGVFPSTRVFSALARTIDKVDLQQKSGQLDKGHAATF